jgi:D-tyrosyl-tRNA(Tyr) deacylase
VRAVVQRVSRADVSVDARVVAEIGVGLMVLLGVAVDDDRDDARQIAEKLVGLRIFSDDAGLMNRSVVDVRGAILLVSQFTLHGDVRKGRRPSFITAAPAAIAKPLYELVGSLVARENVTVKYGEFGADMAVELVNDGPATILLDSKRTF